MNYWDKILDGFDYKSKGGAPDFSNPNDRMLLRMELLKKGWNQNAVNELMYRLSEARSQDQNDYLKSFGEFPWGKDGNKIQLSTALNYASSKDFQAQPYKQSANKRAKQLLTQKSQEGDEMATSILKGKPSKQVKKKVKKVEEPKVTGVDRSKFDKKLKQHKDAPNGPTSQQMLDSLNAGSLDEINKFQDEVERNRAKGIAGAGGPVASEGESKYCQASSQDEKEFNKWKKKNKKKIEAQKVELSKKKRNAEEQRIANALGLDVNSPEFLDYLATRETWAREKLEEAKNDPDSVFYKKGKKGFADATVGGKKDPEGAYLAWMRVAFDGGQTTKRLLGESELDTTKEHRVVQSTQEIDDSVQAHLEDQLKNAKTPEDKKYYKKQLKLFKKFREYHDTFAIGVDKNGRTCVVSISNKKDGQIKDPQNNTTPAQRLRIMKEQFGDEVGEDVTKVIDDGIARVSNAQADTVKKQTDMEITDEVVTACTLDNMDKYMSQLNDKANDTRSDKYGKKMGAWLAGPPKKNWPTGNSPADVKKKLQLMQEFAKSKLFDKNGKSRLDEREDGTYYLDDNGDYVKIKHLGQIGLPYEPFGKISIKLGQFQVNDEVMGIKAAETSTVEDTHTEVVSKLFESDEPDGYEPDKRPTADNGKNTQAYIEGVLGSMHINSYIDMEDDDDDKMIIQCGINGVKPSMIRECTAEKSGYPGDVSTPEGRQGLKDYLRKRCRVTPGGEKVSIQNEGKDVELFTDQWRTAGTAQKVASYFGKDMRECLQEKAAKK